MARVRRSFSGAEKMVILRAHLIDKVPVSEVCDKYGVPPTLFYGWQKKLFEEGAVPGRRDRVPMCIGTGQVAASAGGRAAADRRSGGQGPGEERGSGRADGRARGAKKKSWGDLKAQWVAHDVRDEVVDFVNRWASRAELAVAHMVGWLGVGPSKFYDWRSRYGKVNEHNARVPRDHWLEDEEKAAILDFEQAHPLEGYRRLTFVMLDRDIVAASPSSV